MELNIEVKLTRAKDAKKLVLASLIRHQDRMFMGAVMRGIDSAAKHGDSYLYVDPHTRDLAMPNMILARRLLEELGYTVTQAGDPETGDKIRISWG